MYVEILDCGIKSVECMSYLVTFIASSNSRALGTNSTCLSSSTCCGNEKDY